MGKLSDLLDGLDPEGFDEGFIASIIEASDADIAELTSANEIALAEKDANANSLQAQIEAANTINAALAAHNTELLLSGGEVEGDHPETGDDDESIDEFIDPVEKYFTDV